MSQLSLQASIRTCSVDSGEATRIQSDRFQNPNNMVCIPWNNQNNKGQEVCVDSQWTKTPGCNSALDRHSVENSLRPQYSDYINLNATAIQGDIYGNQSAWENAGSANSWDDSRNKITGNFGNQWQASNNWTGCSMNAYEKAMAQQQQNNRAAAYANNGYQQHAYKQNSGNANTCGGR